MKETYTFSRALYLMRYGGKKMKPEKSILRYIVIDGKLMWYGHNNRMNMTLALDHDDIMGSWVEVDDV